MLKKIKALPLLVVLLGLDILFAQTIDVSYLNPALGNGDPYTYTRFGNSSNYYAGFLWNNTSSYYGDGNDFSIFTYDDRDITLRPGWGNVIIFPHAGGNLGVGTKSPSAKLDIYVSGATSSYPTSSTRGDILQNLRSNNNGLELGNSRSTNDRKAWILARHSQTISYGKYYSVLHLQPDIGDKSQFRGVAIGYPSSNTIPLGTHLAVNGKVGIGTTSPDSELTVKGNIHAEEVKVDLNVPGPDYVFKEEYDLKSLEEIQNYIKTHGHLPNIPSAREMEANGVQLGIMNMKLLEKIEELTLYTIQQQKEIEINKKAKQELESLKDSYSHLLERLIRLENK